MTWLTAMKYLCRKWPWVCSTCRTTSRSFPHLWLINVCVTRLTGPVPLASGVVFRFSGVRDTRSLVLCVCFVGRWLSFFFWPLCCLSLDLRILITHLVYSNFSYRRICYVEVKSIPIRHIQNCLISNLETGILIKCGGVKRNDNYSCEKIRNLHILVKNLLSSR